MTEQRKEIETIKPRSIELKLSDADVERISKKAGSVGLTVSELLENFIGDLVGGTYSNGSDERDRAASWFDRCGFGMFPEYTFLRYLLEWSDLDGFIDEYETLQEWKGDLDTFEDPEDIEAFKSDIADQEQIVKEYYDDYLHYAPKDQTPETFEEGVKKVLEYKARLEAFKGVTE